MHVCRYKIKEHHHTHVGDPNFIKRARERMYLLLIKEEEEEESAAASIRVFPVSSPIEVSAPKKDVGWCPFQ
jgi:hypothetical protein